MYNNHKILDCHVHFALQNDSNMLSDFLKSTGTDKANIIACSHSTELSLIPKALRMKLKEPNSFFVFGAPDSSAYELNRDDLGKYFSNYTDMIIKSGCDGIKLLEGKPQMRKMYNIPDFDLEVWEPFFSYLEENGVPVLWHVNDPENFWDKENAPSFAVTQGWLYDESYVNNEDQYRQVLNVLLRHPNLKICFAHFFFLSKNLNRLSNILDSYRNVMVDLTPGIEMYENFSKDINETLAFFKKYRNRISYGTDIGGRCVLMGEQKEFDTKENQRRPEIVRTFLESKESVLVKSDGHYLIGRPDFKMNCLGLSDDILSEIYFDNFMNFVNHPPKETTLELIEQLELYIRNRKELLGL